MAIFRCSLVHEYSALEPKKETPLPFCEFRVFIFKNRPLTLIEQITIKRVLRTILEKMRYLFWSIAHAMAVTRNVGYDEKTEFNFPIRGNIVTEIHGFEVEEVDYDEVAQYFRSNGTPIMPERIPFDIPYRYACFYDEYGMPKAEYNEWDIQRMETSMSIERRALSYKIISFLQEEYFPILRAVEEMRMRYEEMLRMLAK
jgi:hypothetical protein